MVQNLSYLKKIKFDHHFLNEDLPFESFLLDSTLSYQGYIKNCPDDLLYAHVYVRYLGDLKGGQMIAKRVPGSGLYYKFENQEELEIAIRSKLREDDLFVAECKKCFTFATNSFNDLKEYIDSNLNI